MPRIAHKFLTNTESYTIDPLSRFDQDDILMLIRQKRYLAMAHQLLPRLEVLFPIAATRERG